MSIVGRWWRCCSAETGASSPSKTLPTRRTSRPCLFWLSAPKAGPRARPQLPKRSGRRGKRRAAAAALSSGSPRGSVTPTPSRRKEATRRKGAHAAVTSRTTVRGRRGLARPAARHRTSRRSSRSPASTSSYSLSSLSDVGGGEGSWSQEDVSTRICARRARATLRKTWSRSPRGQTEARPQRKTVRSQASSGVAKATRPRQSPAVRQESDENSSGRVAPRTGTVPSGAGKKTRPASSAANLARTADRFWSCASLVSSVCVSNSLGK
mmetsp:Transcript_16966/g.51474  ORF Transcript_16966/g.51474 Transcript_16966/m.51474 type:complete len:267 (+) Transcript_16966:525-1325(+)